MENIAQLQDELYIHDVETIKVFADERRLKILEMMQQPTTVKAVAAELKLSASKLYYHINLLQKHGLIQSIDYNIESGIVEKIYQVTARQFKIRNPMLVGDALPDEGAEALFNSMLDETKSAFQHAFRVRDRDEGTPPRYPFISKKRFHLTDEQLTAFHAKLSALIQEADTLAEANQDLEEDPFELVLVFYKEIQS